MSRTLRSLYRPLGGALQLPRIDRLPATMMLYKPEFERMFSSSPQARSPELEAIASVASTTSTMGFDMFSGSDMVAGSINWIVDAYNVMMEKSMIVGYYSFQLFLGVHNATGLNYGYVIPITCILLRLTMTLPVSFWSRKNAQKMNKLSDVVLSSAAVIGNAARRRSMILLPKLYDKTMVPDTSSPPKLVDAFFAQPEGQLTRKSVTTFLREYNRSLNLKFDASLYKTYAVAFSQMVILFFGSRGVAYYSNARSDATAVLSPGTNYSDQGMLWFTNLDVVDPYTILPLAFTATTFFNIEGFVRESDSARKFRQTPRSFRTSVAFVLSRTGGLFLISLSFFYPSSYTIYWLTSALYSVVQNAFMRRYYPFVPDKTQTEPLAEPTNAKRIMLDLDEKSMTKLLKTTIPEEETIKYKVK
ncbi:hypothetical protein V1512DRAFT_258916 [Lipomyces arxii]|uniref:uncharacterized protein n=1 Tax=Lipomyces arxii TaxID=56418 RepID=UPI0034CDC01D